MNMFGLLGSDKYLVRNSGLMTDIFIIAVSKKLLLNTKNPDFSFIGFLKSQMTSFSSLDIFFRF